jgi:hypothetical protein
MAAATTSAVTVAATTAAGEESAVHDMAAWKTKSKWLHWDLNPFRWAAGTMPPYEFSEYAWISENNGAPLGPAEFKASPRVPHRNSFLYTLNAVLLAWRFIGALSDSAAFCVLRFKVCLT